MVIDYAESRANLKELLGSALNFFRVSSSGIAGSSGSVDSSGCSGDSDNFSSSGCSGSSPNRARIVLLSRSRGDWWEALLKMDKDLNDMLSEVPPQEIPPLASQDQVDGTPGYFLFSGSGFCRKITKALAVIAISIGRPRRCPF